jgi:hypothetical protein
MGLKFLDDKVPAKPPAKPAKDCGWQYVALPHQSGHFVFLFRVCPECEPKVSLLTGPTGCQYWSEKLKDCIRDVAVRRIAEAEPGSVIKIGEN